MEKKIQLQSFQRMKLFFASFSFWQAVLPFSISVWVWFEGFEIEIHPRLLFLAWELDLTKVFEESLVDDSRLYPLSSPFHFALLATKF